MVKKVTRNIKASIQCELWGRAAGRCQFSGCNQLLYKSTVTSESVNLAQKAHIYSFSENGPRGWGPFKLLDKSGLNDISNLMLMCHGCHKKIDNDKHGQRYSSGLLIKWKEEHESRVEINTGISPDKKTHMVLYGANIGDERSPIKLQECIEAMFPDWYPANERPEILSMHSELKDTTPDYWNAESLNLINAFDRKITTLIEHNSCKHFSIFAFAPQPLLIKLGTLFTDKISVETYQLSREPKGWKWQDKTNNFEFKVKSPNKIKGVPVLVFSLSDHVNKNRIIDVLGKDIDIWEVTIENPNNDFLKSKHQLSQFRRSVRTIMVNIKSKYDNHQLPIHLFPVMPIACAIELGRIRMPKAEMPWFIYDQDLQTHKFIKTIEI